MAEFSHYLDPRISLEDRLVDAFTELEISEEQQVAIRAILAPLKMKNDATYYHYEHSLRVAFVARRIAAFMHLDEKALFYAGLLHDVGKMLTDDKTLGKVSGWTAADTEEMKSHPMDGYRLLKGRFDFSAEIIVRHHVFQRDGYPNEPVDPTHDYSKGTHATIAFYARLLALADVFDAMHRVNEKSGVMRAFTGEEIKERLLEMNPDQVRLIESLYREGIFPMRTFPSA